jgi:hypothetical protein
VTATSVERVNGTPLASAERGFDAVALAEADAIRTRAEAEAEALRIAAEGKAEAEKIKAAEEAERLRLENEKQRLVNQRAELRFQREEAEQRAKIAEAERKREETERARETDRRKAEETDQAETLRVEAVEKSSQRWRRVAMGFYALCAAVALPVQMAAFYNPHARYLLVAPVFIELIALVALVGAAAAVTAGRPHWHYRLVAWVGALTAATINIVHGLGAFDAATAFGSRRQAARHPAAAPARLDPLPGGDRPPHRPHRRPPPQRDLDRLVRARLVAHRPRRADKMRGDYPQMIRTARAQMKAARATWPRRGERGPVVQRRTQQMKDRRRATWITRGLAAAPVAGAAAYGIAEGGLWMTALYAMAAVTAGVWRAGPAASTPARSRCTPRTATRSRSPTPATAPRPPSACAGPSPPKASRSRRWRPTGATSGAGRSPSTSPRASPPTSSPRRPTWKPRSTCRRTGCCASRAQVPRPGRAAPRPVRPVREDAAAPERKPNSRRMQDKQVVAYRMDGQPFEASLLGVHGIVIASSGGGKSVILRTMADALTACSDVLVGDLDPGGNGLAPLAEALGVRAIGDDNMGQIEAILDQALKIAKARPALFAKLGMKENWEPSPRSVRRSSCSSTSTRSCPTGPRNSPSRSCRRAASPACSSSSPRRRPRRTRSARPSPTRSP